MPANKAYVRFAGTWRTILRRVRLAACLLTFSLTGCATWAKHGIAPRPPEKIRVAVLPVQVAVAVKRLRDIETVPKGRASAPEEQELIAGKMRQAADDITRDIEAKLGASYFFEVAPDSDVRKALEAAGLASSTAALTVDQVKGLGAALGVQAMLSTKVAGYGKIKKRWLVYLIGSGFVEGLVQAVVVASVVSNPWVAVGVGVEEAAQESLEWGGGAFLFNKIYSPVILEGELASAADGKIIWSGTSLENSDRKDVKKLAKEDQAKKELRLRLTARKAAEKLVRKIDKKAWSNLKNADRLPTRNAPK